MAPYTSFAIPYLNMRKNKCIGKFMEVCYLSQYFEMEHVVMILTFIVQ